MNSAVQQIKLSDGWTGMVYHKWNFPGEVIKRWDSLASEYGDKGIFLSYGWFEQWWKAFNKTRSLFVVVLFKDGAARAIFPCCLNTSIDNRYKREEISSLTNDHTCHYDFLIDTGCGHQAISQFVKILRMSHPDVEMQFEYMPAKGENNSALIEVLRSNSLPFHKNDSPWAPWIEIPDNWSSFENKLSSSMKNNLRRYLKRAEGSGNVQFEVVKNTEKLDKILDIMFEIELQSWKGDNGTAIKSQPEIEDFYRQLAHWAMQNNHLQLFLLKIGDLPIAANYCLHSGKTVYQLKIGYLESYKKNSPGKLLHREIIKYLCESKCFAKYDLLGACDPWKMEWTQDCCEYGFIRAYPRSLRGWIVYNTKYGWKTFLKRFHAVRQLKSWFDKGKDACQKTLA